MGGGGCGDAYLNAEVQFSLAGVRKFGAEVQ